MSLLRETTLKGSVEGKQWLAFAGKRKKDKERYTAFYNAVHGKSRAERARRAERILRVPAWFTRKCGSFRTPYSHGVVLATLARARLQEALQAGDFHDRAAGETPQTRLDRQQCLLAKFDERYFSPAGWVTPAMHAAYILDPRHLQFVADVEAERKAQPDDWDPVGVWQAAKPHAHAFVSRFFASAPGRLQVALAELDAYVCRSGIFSDLELPSYDEKELEPRVSIQNFWQARAPTRELHRVALACVAGRLASTVAELGWAALSRQCTPVRNRLSPTTKSLVTDIVWNARHLARFKEWVAPQGSARSNRERGVAGGSVALDADQSKAETEGAIFSDSDSSSSRSSGSSPGSSAESDLDRDYQSIDEADLEAMYRDLDLGFESGSDDWEDGEL